MLINWIKRDNRYIEGQTELGSVWIHSNREKILLAIYTMFGMTVKYNAEERGIENVEEAKIELEYLLDLEIKSRELSNQLRSKIK